MRLAHKERLTRKEWEAKWQSFMFRLVSGMVSYTTPELAQAVRSYRFDSGKNPGNNKG